MDRQVNVLSRDGHYARAARLRTFQPMLRTALLCLIVAVVGLTALSEIGVNVAPLLAGAGIVGIAIGFGSQKLVQDLITGLFLLLEQTVQVGDNVSLSGLSGTKWRMFRSAPFVCGQATARCTSFPSAP